MLTTTTDVVGAPATVRMPSVARTVAPAPNISVPRRSTNLDGIRLLAAAAVVVGHAYDLTGRPAPTVAGIPMSSLAVMIFFITSGWLISSSWDRNPDWAGYLRNRSLRIFPALVVTVLVTTFVLGPAFSTLSTSEYFADSQTWAYLRNSLLWTEHSLPGLFADNTYPFAVNGSLWTLPIEFLCYLALPVVGLIPGRARTAVMGALAVAGIAGFYLIPPTTVVLFAVLSLVTMLAGFFAAGAFLQYVTAGRREVLRVDVAAFALAGIPTAVALVPQYAVAISGVLLPYVVITLALASTPVLRRAARYGDFSYGLYLWAFPVQQLVVHLVGPQPMYLNLPLVLAASMALAVASWRWIEKPTMALRGRGQPANRARAA